jgi:hypothetical protein
MTKRSKRSQKPTTLGVIVALIIAVIAALQSAQKTNAPAPTAIVITQLGLITATAAPGLTAINNPPTASTGTVLPTQPPSVTSKPLPTDLPGIEITPINGALYEVTGSVSGLGCPDSRCKVVNEYKKGNIVGVTGAVDGTTYKTKKTRVWYVVIFHDGSKIFIHGGYLKPYLSDR